MTKNAMIIMILAGCLLVYLLLDTFVLTGSTSTASVASEYTVKEQTITDAMSTITAQLGAKKLKPTELQLIELLKKQWDVDPFIAELTPEQVAKKAAEDVVVAEGDPLQALTYDGYMSSGDWMIAFISGKQYEVGDTLQELGYRIEQITSEVVTLEDPATENRMDLVLEPDDDMGIVF